MNPFVNPLYRQPFWLCRLFICQQDFQAALASDTIKGIDVVHQLYRLRTAKNLPDAEVELMMRSLAENVQSYEQVVEVTFLCLACNNYRLTSLQLLALLPPHTGGLLPISFCLFHQQELIREYTVDIFNELRTYPVGPLYLIDLLDLRFLLDWGTISTGT